MLTNEQVDIVKFIKEKKKCAIHGLGIGKTLATLTAIKELIDSKLVKSVLILAPFRAANFTWVEELEKWSYITNLTYTVNTDDQVKRAKAFAEKTDIYLLNYEKLPWLMEAGHTYFDMIVLDESHRVKSPKTKVFRALKRMHYKYMAQLTGTPAPNGELDLWSQAYLLDRGDRLGRSITWFRHKYFYVDRSGFKYYPKDPQAIWEAISDIAISFAANKSMNMPLITYENEYIEVDEKVISMYNKFKNNLCLTYGHMNLKAQNAAVLVNKLLQFCNGAIYNEGGVYTVHDGKLKALKKIVADNPDKNILVAYYFKHDLRRLTEEFKEAVVLDKHASQVEAWNKGEIKMLLLSCGTGNSLNLQMGGNMIVWFTMMYDLEKYTQFNGRLYRRGQPACKVIVKHILMKQGMDEYALSVVKRKRNAEAKGKEILSYNKLLLEHLHT